MQIVPNLIFDLGMHYGLDTKNYLAKGFNVVAVEAVPALCARGKAENEEHCNSGALTIIQKAIHDVSGQTVSFFVNPDHDDWGSLDRAASEKGIGESYEITVETITLAQLFAEHGVPYFLKCDLEGGDAIFARNLVKCPVVPTFVSIEATSIDDLAMIRASGYDRFQIVNQWMNPYTKCPNPPREGNYVDIAFNHHMSGLFARELAPDGWVNFEQMVKHFLAWYDCHKFSPGLGIGWLDVHGGRSDVIGY